VNQKIIVIGALAAGAAFLLRDKVKELGAKVDPNLEQLWLKTQVAGEVQAKQDIADKPPVSSQLPAKTTEGYPGTTFTGSVPQLDWLEELVGNDSVTYREAVDKTYEAVAAQLGPDQVVAWSSEKGYHVVDNAVAAGWDYPF